MHLLKKEPDNPEYRAFVPQMAALLEAAMELRSKGLAPEDFAREARAIVSGITGLAGRSVRDPALQSAQNIFREHASGSMRTGCSTGRGARTSPPRTTSPNGA